MILANILASNLCLFTGLWLTALVWVLENENEDRKDAQLREKKVPDSPKQHTKGPGGQDTPQKPECHQWRQHKCKEDLQVINTFNQGPSLLRDATRTVPVPLRPPGTGSPRSPAEPRGPWRPRGPGAGRSAAAPPATLSLPGGLGLQPGHLSEPGHAGLKHQSFPSSTSKREYCGEM